MSGNILIFREKKWISSKGDISLIDKPLILRKLTELDEYLEQTREFLSITLEEYSRDWKAQRIVETPAPYDDMRVCIQSHVPKARLKSRPTS